MSDSLIIPVVLSTPNRAPVAGLVESLIVGFGLCRRWIDQIGDGAALSTRKAISWANVAFPSSYVLFCEDDVQMHSSAASRIQSVQFPYDVGVISFCDMRELEEGTVEGLYTRNALGCDNRGWWGNQAMLIHPDTAHLLRTTSWKIPLVTRSRGYQSHKVAYADDGKNCSDISMSIVVDGLGGKRNKYAVHVPSLFKHIGHRSTCFPHRAPELGERATRNWIGDL